MAQISALEGDSAEIADMIGKKPSIGKSGVHLCYHTNLEYCELTAEQKRELSEWRESNPDFQMQQIWQEYQRQVDRASQQQVSKE